MTTNLSTHNPLQCILNDIQHIERVRNGTG